MRLIREVSWYHTRTLTANRNVPIVVVGYDVCIYVLFCIYVFLAFAIAQTRKNHTQRYFRQNTRNNCFIARSYGRHIMLDWGVFVGIFSRFKTCQKDIDRPHYPIQCEKEGGGQRDSNPRPFSSPGSKPHSTVLHGYSFASICALNIFTLL